ncbi:MAG: hypothetical protein GY703_01355 [Gammaproteobacteria bacterium]|nr:hypothetical protein [Gammaproteobacteria bacterium]
MKRWRPARVIWTCFLCVLFQAGGVQAQLQLEALQVSDVTPSGFTLLGHASEASTTRLRVYSDENGTQEITDQLETVTGPLRSGDPSAESGYYRDESRYDLRDQTESRGLIHIRVEGTQPQTAYYYHLIADSGSETAQWPIDLPAMVTTTRENSFIAGAHQVLLTLNAPDPGGWLVTIRSDENDHPVSAVVGDGTASNQAYLNLSNLFTTGGRNWQPDGDKELTIEIRRGWQSTVTEQVTLGLSNGFGVSSLHPVAIDLLGGPQLDLLLPVLASYTTGEAITIGWTDASDADASISLHHDQDGTGTGSALIVDGLDENPDDTSDQYSWNTAGVPDGLYYIYGVINDGSSTVTSYAPARVAIDRGGVDSDTDTIADLWEQLFFGDLSVSPASTTDLDLDGLTDGREFGERTNPGLPDVRLALTEGFNLVSFPVAPSGGLTSLQLAQQLAPNLVRISRLDQATQTLQITEVVDGTPQGANFSLVANEGYSIHMSASRELVIQGTAVTGAINLSTGMNLAGFTRVPAGTTAYGLLDSIGGDGTIASIRHFDSSTGRYQTVGYREGVRTGPDFPIRRGEAYLFSMLQGVMGVMLP